MKLKDFDFRIWSENKKAYINNAVLAKPNDIVELWSGAYDYNNKKIFEGDIVEIFGNYDADEDEISFVDVVRFNYEDGFHWEFSGDKWQNQLELGEKFRKDEELVIRGNVNENKDIYDKIIKDNKKKT